MHFLRFHIIALVQKNQCHALLKYIENEWLNKTTSSCKTLYFINCIMSVINLYMQIYIIYKMHEAILIRLPSKLNNKKSAWISKNDNHALFCIAKYECKKSNV